MNKIIAFGASSSKNSINKKLASFVANKIADQEAVILDLNDFEMPIYSEDRHAEEGIPQKALAFKKIIKESKGLVISLAEHNGSYTAAFKNIYDWISVIEKTVWSNKPILLMSTSDGARGGKVYLKQLYLVFQDKVILQFLILYYQIFMKIFLKNRYYKPEIKYRVR